MAGKVSRELTWGPTCISSRCRQLSPLSARAAPFPASRLPGYLMRTHWLSWRFHRHR